MTSTSMIPDITLNNGVTIPQLGYGIWQVARDQTAALVGHAFDAGYRHVDGAAAYGNERELGQALAATDIPRDQLFITTKLWNADQGYDSTLRAFDTSMGKLGLDVLDLYLIHWPTPTRGLYGETWRAFEKLLADGRIRTIGVSNFRVEDLQHLLDEYDVVPAVNQIELHPQFQQPELRQFHTEHGIATEAYSPLGHGELLKDPVIGEIADAHGVSPAQVLIRWHLDLGNILIPKASSPERISQNIDVFGFSLTDEELARIDGLETGERGSGQDPATFTGLS
jgi:2,5-diketo-D-gluconate reductase A